MSLNPALAIYPEAIAKTTPLIQPSSAPFRKPKKKRVFQEDEINSQQLSKITIERIFLNKVKFLCTSGKKLSMHIARRPSSVLQNRGQWFFYS